MRLLRLRLRGRMRLLRRLRCGMRRLYLLRRLSRVWLLRRLRRGMALLLRRRLMLRLWLRDYLLPRRLRWMRRLVHLWRLWMLDRRLRRCLLPRNLGRLGRVGPGLLLRRRYRWMIGLDGRRSVRLRRGLLLPRRLAASASS